MNRPAIEKSHCGKTSMSFIWLPWIIIIAWRRSSPYPSCRSFKIIFGRESIYLRCSLLYFSLFSILYYIFQFYFPHAWYDILTEFSVIQRICLAKFHILQVSSTLSFVVVTLILGIKYVKNSLQPLATLTFASPLSQFCLHATEMEKLLLLSHMNYENSLSLYSII